MGNIQHLNPDTLHRNPAFTQLVTVDSPCKTIYIGGQNGVNAQGEIVGKGDLGAQATQAFRNIVACLDAAGAKLEDIVKWTIFAVQGHNFEAGFRAFMQVWGERPNPPAISMAVVAGLANPRFPH